MSNSNQNFRDDQVRAILDRFPDVRYRIDKDGVAIVDTDGDPDLVEYLVRQILDLPEDNDRCPL